MGNKFLPTCFIEYEDNLRFSLNIFPEILPSNCFLIRFSQRDMRSISHTIGYFNSSRNFTSCRINSAVPPTLSSWRFGEYDLWLMIVHSLWRVIHLWTMRAIMWMPMNRIILVLSGWRHSFRIFSASVFFCAAHFIFSVDLYHCKRNKRLSGPIENRTRGSPLQTGRFTTRL